MATNEVILRFNGVSFEYGPQKPILMEAEFSVRRGSKITLMGQNGSGKSTIFKLITGEIEPESGAINIGNGLTIALSKQVIPRAQMDSTVKEFFESAFSKKVYDIEPRIAKILEVVNLDAPLDRPLKTFSGGQQARLLLAQALIQGSDILLLDEPTNNLDKDGIAHLTKFLKEYKETVIVISHDAEFLNSFTQGVIYLDIFTKKTEQYAGDYLFLVEEIKNRLERERMKNARLEKEIAHRKEQANFFSQKGGHMRDVARKMNENIEKLEGEMVETRQEDKTIRNFAIPCQEDLENPVLTLKSVSVIKNHKATAKKVDIVLKKKEHLLLSGPNGIGKTTLLEALASGHAKGEHVSKDARIGYYRQDFSTLNFEETVYNTLKEVAGKMSEEDLRSHAAGFLLTSEILKTKIGSLSEGQKGLVAFARLVLERPGLLILDEPTNHINFRHIPIIAGALNRFEGAMVLVSHIPDFVAKIKIDKTLDMGLL
ncbi:MAG: ABC transporter ATP-binding protein [Parcubacteria group bacterium LiPW_15]|nr:MAG: ABC transporter ATP-binding protein [Parcubacteria group bacterium LiPW_15]